MRGPVRVAALRGPPPTRRVTGEVSFSCTNDPARPSSRRTNDGGARNVVTTNSSGRCSAAVSSLCRLVLLPAAPCDSDSFKCRLVFHTTARCDSLTTIPVGSWNHLHHHDQGGRSLASVSLWGLEHDVDGRSGRRFSLKLIRTLTLTHWIVSYASFPFKPDNHTYQHIRATHHVYASSLGFFCHQRVGTASNDTNLTTDTKRIRTK